jgi:hypothetical protein
VGKITEPKPVKLFVGMLSNNVSLFEELKTALQKLFGDVDIGSDIWPWEHTEYYEKEMGPVLKRQFIFFEKLINPGSIAKIKLQTIELERQHLTANNKRKINLDPGYLDSSKLVLVSTKNYSHRIYLGNGMYGEVTLIYSGNTYQTLPYTYPDYRTPGYLEVFQKAREIYKRQTS